MLMPVAIRTEDRRYRPGLLVAAGGAIPIPDMAPHWSHAGAKEAAAAAAALLDRIADLVMADPEWTGDREQARADAAALMEEAPIIPDPADLAEMVLEAALG